MEIDQNHVRETRAQMVSAIREAAGDLRHLVAETVSAILKRDDFKRAYETFLRIEAAHRFDKDERIDRDEVRRDFATLVQGYILRAKGHTYHDVGEKLGDDRVVAWLQREQIPFSMYRDDPTRNAHFVKRMAIPEVMSTDFAYVLGAYAGSRRPTSESVQVNFQNTSPALIEKLCERVSSACGIDMKVRQIQVGPQVYTAATSRAHELAEYLAGVSRGNTAVPWVHIHSSEERRAFLRGFFDFGGGTVDLEKGRFAVTRNENPRLLEEVAILLKREGVNARLRTGDTTTIFVDAAVELIALAALDVVQRPELASRLKTVSEIPSTRQLVSATDYDTVMETARRLRGVDGVSPARVADALAAANHPCKALPATTIRNWLSGDFEPPSAKRRREVEDIERKNFTPNRLEEIGRAVLQRLPQLPHPYVVVEAISEFVGGAHALASLVKIESEAVVRTLAREQLPSGSAYRAILGAVGLDYNARIEAGARCPDVDSVRALFPAVADQYLFSTYRASIMLRVKEAFERGEDTAAAAREALRRASERGSRVNGLV